MELIELVKLFLSALISLATIVLMAKLIELVKLFLSALISLATIVLMAKLIALIINSDFPL